MQAGEVVSDEELGARAVLFIYLKVVLQQSRFTQSEFWSSCR